MNTNLPIERSKKKKNVTFKEESQNTKLDWYVVGEYRISHTCIDEDVPCLHYIYIKDSDIVYVLNGKDIYSILKKKGLSHPHFNKYKDIIDMEESCSVLCCGLC